MGIASNFLLDSAGVNTLKKAAIFLLVFFAAALSYETWQYFHEAPITQEQVTTGTSISDSQLDPTQKMNRLRIVIYTTSDWNHVIVPPDSKIINSKKQLLSGTGNLAVDEGKVVAAANSLGSPASYQFDILLSTDGVSDEQWQLKKGWGTSTHVDIYNTNDINNPVLISSQDCTLMDKVFIVSGSMASQAGPLSAGTTGAKRVFAVYYPWWPTSDSWRGVSDLPLTSYSTTNQQDVVGIVNRAASLGIDGFFVSFQGIEYSQIAIGTRALLDAANAKGDFSVAMYLETRVANAQHDKSCLPDPACQPDPAIIKQWIRDLVLTYSNDPSYLKMEKMINGSAKLVPVIQVYWAGASWNDQLQNGYLSLSQWQQIFSDLSAEGIDAFYLADSPDISYLSVFDGLYSYALFFLDDAQLDTYVHVKSYEAKTYSLLNDPQAQRKLFMGSVSPGIDYSGAYVDRANGEKYRSMWAINSQYAPDWVMITTWNEHYENTNVVATLKYGTFYEDLTRELAAQFKGASSIPLSVSVRNVYWADYNSYTSRILNVDYNIENAGSESVFNLTILSMSASNGASSASTLPNNVGDIGAGAAKTVSLRWKVPAGVSSFYSHLRAQANTATGAVVYFPSS